MLDSELLAHVNEAERDAVRYSSEWMRENEDYLKRYYKEPYGDEVAGKSQVVTSDVADTIESDITSLVRVFLGSREVMIFEPNSSSDGDKLESQEKTRYINWLVRNQPTSFKVLHDWMKDALIQKLGVVKFGYEETERTEIEEYDGISEEELQLIDVQLKLKINDGQKVEYIGQSDNDDGTKYVKVRRTWVEKSFFVRGVPTESFIISRNAVSKDDADVVGDIDMVTKSELIAAGYPESVVKTLPAFTGQESRSTMKSIRFKAEGGADIGATLGDWPNHLVEVSYLYIKIDYDNDGIAERRYIVRAGNQILENEQHEMVPYALNSAILMPHSAIGRGRAELVTSSQRVSTVLTRQMLDNNYLVNNGRVVVNDDETNIDDLLTVRQGGVVRTKGDPTRAVFPLVTPYIGQQTLQVLQYMDSLKSQTTGNQLANQGLDTTRFNEETATRFNGMEKSGAAKVELIARVFAETGYRDLYAGMAWYVARYQVEEKEIMVLGKPLTVNPLNWVSDSMVTSSVGLAAGDDEETLQNMGQLLAIHQQLGANGSTVTDPLKVYNIMAKILESMGINRVSDFANDPTKPEEVLLAENVQLKNAVQQMQQMLQDNPLAEAEEVKAQAGLIKAQATQELNIAKLLEDQRQFNETLTAKTNKTIAELETKYVELELKYETDIKGKGQEPDFVFDPATGRVS
ncbi:MAG: hypothetical protein DRH37_04620 [Deltaproteobacteria bacterium]|nr:MAG: hypothetical protein DRH37_04620 [Deltaproteobacteria bacterium]